MTEKRAVILFTRIPVPGLTKTRLMPYYTPEQCAELHLCFLRDIRRNLSGIDADLFIYYAEPGDPAVLKEIFGNRLPRPRHGWIHGSGKITYRPQVDLGLGERMYQAMEDVLNEGYDSCVLTGTDLPDLTKEIFEDAFARLKTHDVVLGPTRDGGYYLIGSKVPQHVCFENQVYGGSSVFENTAAAVLNHGLSLSLAEVLHDVDTRKDLIHRLDRRRKNPETPFSHTDRFILQHVKISVIVPVCNEENMIRNIQKELRRTFASCEVIFVDGKSTDGTLSRIDPEMMILNSEKGRARQVNLGAEEASGDILFFLHCDSKLPAHPQREIRHVYAEHLAGCFRIGFPTRRFLMLTNSILSNRRARNEGIMFGDQGIFIDRRLFFKMGGFPDIPLMEDYQFSLNLKRHGISNGVAHEKIISSDRRYPRSTKGTLRLMKKMYDMRQMYLHGADPGKLAKMYKDIR
ncbi:MAG: TIGR04283 family arsenosugar biosynthesis glycosyltransferase [Clostridiales bacterium]|jgi:rSAM/selenodomain-associated transferase 2/rSAM/selenodomain-associated transferase 1|nr:TIGR04283 family arsenosugar biosynthesis glycosyltransferase [Clostridiales bacterium]